MCRTARIHAVQLEGRSEVKSPNVQNVLQDDEAGITYSVMAYRRLTKTEVLEQIRNYYSTRSRKKKPKAGTTVTIVTIIGYDQR
jgi:hypothetical protein